MYTFPPIRLLFLFLLVSCGHTDGLDKENAADASSGDSAHVIGHAGENNCEQDATTHAASCQETESEENDDNKYDDEDNDGYDSEDEHFTEEHGVDYSPLLAGTYVPAPDNTFNDQVYSKDLTIMGATSPFPATWNPYKNCFVTLREDYVTISCDVLGTLGAEMSLEGSRITLREDNILSFGIDGSMSTIVFSYIKK